MEQTQEFKPVNNTKLTTTKRKKSRFFETYISKVLKQVSNNEISLNAKQQLNSAIYLMACSFSSTSTQLTKISNKKTISEKEIINTINLFLSGDLASNAIKEGLKSITNFQTTLHNNGNTTRQVKSHILFPPSITEKFLRNFGYSKIMITSSAPIFLAAVLEYITAEILVLSSLSAKNNQRTHITIKDLQISIENDPELNSLFKKNNISFLGGGVIPFINPHLNKQTNVETKTRKINNSLIFSKSPFERLIRDIVSYKKQNMKISKDVFLIIQYYIEQYIFNIIKDANLATTHSGRVKLTASDIAFICKIKGIKTHIPNDKNQKNTQE